MRSEPIQRPSDQALLQREAGHTPARNLGPGWSRHPLTERFGFPPDVIMDVELATGFHSAVLRTLEVLSGPPLSNDPFYDVLPVRRIISISLYFHLSTDPIRLEVSPPAGGRFRWPLPGADQQAHHLRVRDELAALQPHGLRRAVRQLRAILPGHPAVIPLWPKT